MTQEELAEALGIGVDAVGKYERSLSYIRGDLEHRLDERLGWSRQDIVACRQDWEAGRPRASAPGYRLLREGEVLGEFGGSAAEVMQATAALESGDTDDLPEGFSAGDSIWADILNDGTLTAVYVMQGTEIVAHVALVFPVQPLERRFHDRRLEEGELAPDGLKRTILPGAYFAYCPAVYVARGHEAAARPLLSGFVGILEELAEREVFLREIGAMSVNALGRQLCEDLGLRFLGEHRHHAGFGVWTFPGARFATSLFGRRSAKVRLAYRRPGVVD